MQEFIDINYNARGVQNEKRNNNAESSRGNIMSMSFKVP